ncbi:MAG: hypothetical protein Q9O24_02620 [Gammaproteobacteria bacterium]|nr:hypothetical protein [Gammaproteobacteria bacterium]
MTSRSKLRGGVTVGLSWLAKLEQAGLRVTLYGNSLLLDGAKSLLTKEVINRVAQNKAVIKNALRQRSNLAPSLGRQALKPKPAKAAVKVYRYQIDGGGNWLTLIAPNNNLEQAKKRLRYQYGERLTTVVPVASE